VINTSLLILLFSALLSGGQDVNVFRPVGYPYYSSASHPQRTDRSALVAQLRQQRLERKTANIPVDKM